MRHTLKQTYISLLLYLVAACHHVNNFMTADLLIHLISGVFARGSAEIGLFQNGFVLHLSSDRISANSEEEKSIFRYKNIIVTFLSKISYNCLNRFYIA